MIDLGCGTGLYMANFKCKKSGIDISEDAFDKDVLLVDKDLVKFGDLRLPQNGVERVDLVLCLEVVEHIGCEFADILVKNITDYSDLIIMTAAGIGQAGLNHVNCQPMKYWDEKFERLGFERQYHDEFEIINQVHKYPHTIWLIRNFMIFKRN
jgi:SAM-dependent methyltransferase